MLNNKKAWHIHQLAGKRPGNYLPLHKKSANVLENSKYGDEFAGIIYSSQYSKYFKGLLKDMQQLYIHPSLLWVGTQSQKNLI